MKRAFLRVESLDGLILPGTPAGGIDFRNPGAALMGAGTKPGGVGDGVQVSGGSKGVARPGDPATDAIVLNGSKPSACGSTLKHDTDTDVDLTGGSKPGASGSTLKLDTDTGIELFGSKPVASAGSNSIGETNTGFELFGTGYKPGTTGG
jgi:hypothetical protein